MAAKLTIVGLASTPMAFTNCVYINGAASALVSRVDGRDYVEVEDKYVFCVMFHDSVKPGEIGLGSMQRTLCGRNTGDQLSVKPWVPPKALPVLSALLCSILVEQVSKRKGVVDEDRMVEFLRKTYRGHLLHHGQDIICDYEGRNFKLSVRSVQTAEEKAGSQPMVGVEAKMGMLVETTQLHLTPVSKEMEWKKSNAATRNALLDNRWNFEEMEIGGLDRQFEIIFRRAFASRLYSSKLIKELGGKHVRGMLLYGPPGTGKTLIARKIGQLLHGREPKVVNGPEILNKYVGQSEENIRNLFKDAEDDAKANGDAADLHIIIFDEIDAICKQRGSVQSGTGVHDTIVNQLLSKLDGVSSLDNILVIGMTNRKDLIDEALLRPGRLELHVEISLPDEAGREQIFRIHTKTMRQSGRLADDVDLKKLAAMTKNFSGAEIAGVVHNAQSNALYTPIINRGGQVTVDLAMAEKIVVRMEHFLKALEETTPAFGVNKEDLKFSMPNGIISYGPRFDELLKTCDTLIRQVATSPKTPLLSILLRGEPGSGKTALSAFLAQRNTETFPYVKMIRPEDYVGYSETNKAIRITKVFEDAYRSPLSIVIIDNIERLLEYVPVVPVRFSSPVLQAIMVLVTRRPEKPGHRLLIIGTTSHPEFLDQVQLAERFDVTRQVPLLEEEAEIASVLAQQEVPIAPRDKEEISKNCVRPIGVRELLMLIEMARQSPDGVTWPSFKECMAHTALQRRADKRRQAQALAALSMGSERD